MAKTEVSQSDSINIQNKGLLIIKRVGSFCSVNRVNLLPSKTALDLTQKFMSKLYFFSSSGRNRNSNCICDFGLMYSWYL